MTLIGERADEAILRSGAARISRISVKWLTAPACLPAAGHQPARPAPWPPPAGHPPDCMSAGYNGRSGRHLLRERRFRVVAAEGPAGPQMNEHFLAAARGISQPPLVAAVYPPRHHAAARAGRLAGAGPDQHTHRPARSIEMLDGQTSQVRDKDAESLKIARPA
jgi:hypothetical protein